MSQMLHETYSTKILFTVYLKFKFNWTPLFYLAIFVYTPLQFTLYFGNYSLTERRKTAIRDRKAGKAPICEWENVHGNLL